MNHVYIAQVSPEAQQLGDDITFMGNALDTASDSLLPVAAAAIAFYVCARIIRRFFWV